MWMLILDIGEGEVYHMHDVKNCFARIEGPDAVIEVHITETASTGHRDISPFVPLRESNWMASWKSN
jgi:hypothetical protein